MNSKFFKSIIPLIVITMFLSGCGEAPQNGGEMNADSTAVGETQGVPVEITVVSKKILDQEVPLTGVLEPVGSVDIVAEVSGKIMKIKKELGQYVTTEDTLAIIDDRIPFSNYEQARAQVLSAENNLHIAKLNLESDEELLATGDISKLAYENSVFNFKTAEANLLSAKATFSLLEKEYNDTRVKSPINGYISRKHIDVGTMVSITSPLYRVVDLNTLKLKVGVPQSIIGQVKPGSKAEINVSGLNNGSFNGYVKYVSPQADEQTGSFLIEIYIKNTTDKKIRAGMTASVNLIISAEDERLVVPDHSIVTRNGGYYVYLVNDDYAKLTEIELGKKYGNMIEVVNGITEGDKVVVVGMKNLGVNTKIWVESVN